MGACRSRPSFHSISFPHLHFDTPLPPSTSWRTIASGTEAKNPTVKAARGTTTPTTTVTILRVGTTIILVAEAAVGEETFVVGRTSNGAMESGESTTMECVLTFCPSFQVKLNVLCRDTTHRKTTIQGTMLGTVMVATTGAARTMIEDTQRNDSYLASQAHMLSSLVLIPTSLKQTCVLSQTGCASADDISNAVRTHHQLQAYLASNNCSIETVTIIRDRSTGTYQPLRLFRVPSALTFSPR